MIIIPSALIEVFFEPILDGLKWFWRWFRWVAAYVGFILIIYFGAIIVYIVGDEFMTWILQ